MKDRQTLDDFIKQGGFRSAYVNEPNWKSLYVRYGPKYVLEGYYTDVLTFANIELKRQYRGKGVFTDLIKRIRETYPQVSIFVEITHPRFGAHLEKLGFLRTTNVEFSYFLKAAL